MVGLRPRSKRPQGFISDCQDCHVKLTDATWAPSMQKYRRYVCRVCWIARQERYERSDPDWRQKRKERLAGYQATRTPEEKERQRQVRYASWIRRKYGITIKEYDSMLAQQGGVCAICHKAPVDGKHHGKGALHVDHSHHTGQVRGLLCSICNFVIGLCNDSPEILQTAIGYLSKEKY